MIESIKELRKICQKKEQLYDRKGKENKSKPVQEYFYDRFLRLVSIYITKLFLYTKITANQVSVLSMLVGIIAGVFFSFREPIYWIYAFLLIQLFHFLDAVDGEIARYRKEASPIGKYFDLMAHGVVIASIFIGITFGVYKSINNIFVFFLGLIVLSSFLVSSLSDMIKNFLIYEYVVHYNDKNVLKRIKTKRIKVNSFRYTVKRMLGFDGIPFIILFFTILDMFFPNFSVFSLRINYRFIFLFLMALFTPLRLILKMKKTAGLKNKF